MTEMVYPTYSSFDSLAELLSDIMAFNSLDVPTLGPGLKHAVIDVFLGGWVRECESQRQNSTFLRLQATLIDKVCD